MTICGVLGGCSRPASSSMCACTAGTCRHAATRCSALRAASAASAQESGSTGAPRLFATSAPEPQHQLKVCNEAEAGRSGNVPFRYCGPSKPTNNAREQWQKLMRANFALNMCKKFRIAHANVVHVPCPCRVETMGFAGCCAARPEAARLSATALRHAATSMILACRAYAEQIHPVNGQGGVRQDRQPG